MLKIPPHSIEAEQSVLWSLLIDKDGFITIWDLLKSEDFYDENHSLIYQTMLDLFEQNKPIDLITLREKLDDKNLLQKIGWPAYIIELTNIVPTSANVYEYANIVKNKSVLRTLGRTGSEILGLSYKEEEPLPTLLESAEKSLFSVTQTFIKNRLVHIKEILNQRFEEFSEVHADPNTLKEHRVNLGYSNLEDKLGGLKHGDLCIIAARPAMGKTAFALNLAMNAANYDKTVAIFSLEMSKEQLTDRMISAAIWVDSWKLGKWELTDEEFAKIGDAMDQLSRTNIYIDDEAGGNLMDLKSKARRLKMETGVDMIIIDYLQLMTNGNSLNRVQEISEISRGLKSLARELSIPIIALSQLSRAVESRPDKRPILSDLRESGAIEQDADSVLMLYRADYYADDDFELDEEERGMVNVFIRKNRSGPIGQADFFFDKKHQKFREIDKTHLN